MCSQDCSGYSLEKGKQLQLWNQRRWDWAWVWPAPVSQQLLAPPKCSLGWLLFRYHSLNWVWAPEIPLLLHPCMALSLITEVLCLPNGKRITLFPHTCLICLVRWAVFEAEFFLPNIFRRTPVLCNSELLCPMWVGPMPRKYQWVSAGLQHCSEILSLYLTRWQNDKQMLTKLWDSSVFHCSLGLKETLLPC